MSGGLNPRPLNAPPAAVPAPGVQAGTSGVLVAREVIVIGPAGDIFITPDGIYLYNGTARLGNPPFAYIKFPTVSTDPVGNTVLTSQELLIEGNTIVTGGAAPNFGVNYVGAVMFVNLTSGAASELQPLSLVTSVANPGTVNEQVADAIEGPRNSTNSDFVEIQVVSSSASAAGIATGFLLYSGASFSNQVAAWGAAGFGVLLGSKVQAVQPGTSGATIAAETWHNIPLAAGYAAGAQTPQYQLELGNGNRVRLRGNVALTANQIAGAVFATMPAAYTPSFNQVLPMTPNNMAGNSFNNGNVQVFTTGSLAFGSSGNNGNTFWLDGLTYALA